MTGACATAPVASIKGACDSFDRAEQPIKGANRYSQIWADRQVEAGVSACGFERPKAPSVKTAGPQR